MTTLEADHPFGQLPFEDQRLLGTLYSHPARKYHNAAHVYQVYRYMDVVKSCYTISSDPQWRFDRFRNLIAPWHDAIYTIGAKDNESASIRLFQGSVSSKAFPLATEEVIEGIAASANHWAPANEEKSLHIKIFLDADLYELSSPYELFHHNALNVIEEYASVFDRDTVVAGRKQWYESLLAQDGIYWLANDREDAARRNFERAIKAQY